MRMDIEFIFSQKVGVLDFHPPDFLLTLQTLGLFQTIVMFDFHGMVHWFIFVFVVPVCPPSPMDWLNAMWVTTTQKQELRVTILQLLQDCALLPPNDPYRINVTIVGRYYYMELLNHSEDESITTNPRGQVPKSLQDLCEDAKQELTALHERLPITNQYVPN
jgi:hypothetical protein